MENVAFENASVWTEWSIPPEARLLQEAGLLRVWHQLPLALQLER